MVLRGNADAKLLNMVPGGGQGSGGMPGGKPPVYKREPAAPAVSAVLARADLATLTAAV